MNVPLNVIQDEDGRLRDVNGQPMIVVFPSKPQRPRAVPKSGTSKSEAKTADTQSFAFINVTRPDREDENSRQLIRTHVMKHFHARAREKQKLRSSNGIPRNSNKWKAATENETPVRNDPWHAPVLPAPAIGPEFVVFPVPMQPYMRRLIHQCGLTHHNPSCTISKTKKNNSRDLDIPPLRPQAVLQARIFRLVSNGNDGSCSIPRYTVHFGNLY